MLCAEFIRRLDLASYALLPSAEKLFVDAQKENTQHKKAIVTPNRGACCAKTAKKMIVYVK